MIDDNVVFYSPHDYTRRPYSFFQRSTVPDNLNMNFVLSAIQVIISQLKKINPNSKVLIVIDKINFEKLDNEHLLYVSYALKFYYLTLFPSNKVSKMNTILKTHPLFNNVKFYQGRYMIFIDLLKWYLGLNSFDEEIITTLTVEHPFIRSKNSRSMMNKVLCDGTFFENCTSYVMTHSAIIVDRKYEPTALQETQHSFKIFTQENFSLNKFKSWCNNFDETEVKFIKHIVVPYSIAVDEDLKSKFITYEDLISCYIENVCNNATNYKINPLGMFEFFEYGSSLKQSFINVGQDYMLNYNEEDNFFLSMFIDNIKEAYEKNIYTDLCENLFIFYSIFSSYNFLNANIEGLYVPWNNFFFIEEINEILSMYYIELHFRSESYGHIRYNSGNWGCIIFRNNIPSIIVVYANNPSQLEEREQNITQKILSKYPDNTPSIYYVNSSFDEREDINKYGLTSIFNFFLSMLNNNEDYPQTMDLLSSKFKNLFE